MARSFCALPDKRVADRLFLCNRLCPLPGVTAGQHRVMIEGVEDFGGDPLGRRDRTLAGPKCFLEAWALPRYCFSTFTILSSGLRSISLMRGSTPASVGNLSTVTVNSWRSFSIFCFCK